MAAHLLDRHSAVVKGIQYHEVNGSALELQHITSINDLF